MKENCEIIYKNLEKNEKYESTIKEVVEECFKTEKLDKTNLYISITLTEPNQIEKIKINAEKIQKLLPKEVKTEKETEEFIIKCIKEHNQREERKREMSR